MAGEGATGPGKVLPSRACPPKGSPGHVPCLLLPELSSDLLEANRLLAFFLIDPSLPSISS